MGNNRSKDLAYYDPTVNSTLFDQNSSCKLFRNQHGEEFEMYEVENEGNDDFENRYDYRIKNSSPYLVEAFSLKSKENSFGCASSHIYEVVIERIPSRLHDLLSIPTLESLNIINRSLKGFQQIFKSQGVVLVKDSMIGINKENEVKVWMNSNFSLNEVETPPISYGFLPEIEKESAMVDNIIELVHSRVRRDQEWESFFSKKCNEGRIGFDEAIKLTEFYYKKVLERSRMRDGTEESREKITENYYKSNVNGSRHSVVSSNFQLDNQRSRAKSFGVGELASSFNQHNHAVNAIGSQKLESPIYKVSAMSNLKNKIIRGTTQSNEVQNSNIVPPILRPSPIHLDRKSQFTPQNNINYNPFKPSPVFNVGYQAAPNQQILRPRSFSEGKPIVTFGNGSNLLPYSPLTHFNHQISYKPAPAPNPQINERRKNENIQKLGFNQEISNAHFNKINFQNPSLISSFIPQTPIINNNSSSFRASNQNFSIQTPILPQKYPNEIPNETYFQNTFLGQKTFPTFSEPIKEEKAQAPPFIKEEPLVSTNQNRLNYFNEKETTIERTESNDKNKLENNIDLFTESVHIPNNSNNDHSYAESSYYHVPEVLENDHDPSVKASMESVERETKYERKEQSVPETPFFAKEKLGKEEVQNHKVIPNNINRKIQSEISESQEDRILEISQEQLNELKESKNSLRASNYERSIRESAGSESSKVNINYNLVASENSSLKGSNKIEAPFEQSVKMNEFENGNGKLAKNEEKIVKKEVIVRELSQGNMEDSKKLKEAVHETASNIRLETSKISIKSSSDLKGIISYKDLRDILKSTRKGQF